MSDRSDVSSPKAARQRLPRWLDPKLILGVLFVVVSMALGAQVVARADNTVEIWAVGRAGGLGVGDELDTDDLVPRRVRFASAADANLYVSATDDIPASAHMTRQVAEGEFLPRGAWETEAQPDLRDVPIPVDPANAPSGLRPDDVVDIFVVPDAEQQLGQAPDAQLLLDGVRVLSVGSEGAVGGTSQITVRVRLENNAVRVDGAVRSVAEIASAATTGRPVLVRRATQ